jgi:hypothetical protein
MAKKEIDFKSPDIVELENKIRREEKLRKKAIVDQVLRFLGLILATIIFLITFSMNAPLTLFGALFGYGDASLVWKSGGLEQIFQQGTLYYSFIGPDPTMAIWLMTLIQIGLGVAVAFLYAYYVRDFIGVVKSIFGLGKDIIGELKETVVENVVTVGPDGRKSIFGVSKKDVQKKEQPKKLTKEEKIKAELDKLKGEGSSAQPTQQPAQTEASQQPSEQPTQTDLDKALTDPNYKPSAEQPDPNQRQRRSLFDKK